VAIGTPTVGTYTARTAETSTAVPYPATVNANDLLVMCASVNSASLVTLPAGWTSRVSFSNTGNTLAPDIFIATKTAAGTEGGTTVSVTHPNVVSAWQILAFSGVDLTTPMDATPATKDQTTTANNTTMSLTVVTTNAALVFAAAGNSTTATSSPPTVPGTFTEDGDTGAGGRAFTVCHLLNVASGATGSVANTWTVSLKSCGGLLALRPAITVVTGTLSASLPVVTSSVSGADGQTGTLSSHVPVVTGSISGTVGVPGTLFAALPVVTSSVSGTAAGPVFTGTASAALPVATSAISGSVGVPGTLSASTPVVTASISGVASGPNVTGTLSASIPVVTGSSSGTAAGPVFTGTLSASTPIVTSTITGAAAGPAFSGTESSTLPIITATITGIAAGPSYTATIDASLPTAQASIAGVATAPTYTGTLSSSLPLTTVVIMGTAAAGPARDITVTAALAPQTPQHTASLATQPRRYSVDATVRTRHTATLEPQ
jgi:hypothetical protein